MLLGALDSILTPRELAPSQKRDLFKPPWYPSRDSIVWSWAIPRIWAFIFISQGASSRPVLYLGSHNFRALSCASSLQSSCSSDPYHFQLQMTFQVFKSSDEGAAFVVTLITLPICVLVTILRFVVIKRAGRKIAVEDWFALGALFPYLAWSIYGLVRKWLYFTQKTTSGSLAPFTVTDASLSFSRCWCGEWNEGDFRYA